VGEIQKTQSGETWKFFTCNCSNMVLNVIGAAGALKGEIVLNVWLGTRMPLKPQDIMAISRYLKGNKSVLILPELRS